MNAENQLLGTSRTAWGYVLLLLLSLCPAVWTAETTNASLQTLCERMLSDQREYDSHGALTVARVLDRMADAMSKHASTETVPLLQHADWEIRHAAATALRKTLRKNDHTALVHALGTETNCYVLSALIGCVSATGTREAAPALCRLIEMRVDDNVRREAVVALRQFPNPEAVPVLLRVLDDPSNQVAVEVPYVLGLMGDRRATAKLCEVASDPLRPTRLGAIQALGMIGDSAGAPTLHALLAGQDKGVMRMAVWSLGRAHDVKTVAALLPLLDDRDPAIAKETRTSLVQIGNDEVLTHFIGRYRTDPNDSLALDVVSSIYGQRDRTLGELLKDVPADQITALAKQLSTVSKEKIGPVHIKSIRHLGGTLFVQVVFDGSGSDFIVIRADDGTFKGAKVILSWIE
jgi:HEAT repeat protein